MLYKFIKLIVLSLLLTESAVAATADSVRYYDIEIIVFESTDPAARTSEVWKKNIEGENPQIYVELDQPFPGPLPKEFDPKLTFRKLPQEQLQLTGDTKLLTDSKNYNILYHTAWRQPGMSADIALPVHIHQQYITRFRKSAEGADPEMPAVNLPAPLNVEKKRSILNGFIRIILSRYLHAEVDLTYTTGLPASQPVLLNQDELEKQTEMPTIYRIKQSRKMRSKEVHYLDHPVIGVLVLATPYDEKSLKTTGR